MAVSRVDESTEVTGDPETEAEKVAVAVSPKPPHKTPLQVSTKSEENTFVAWNSGTAGIIASLASPLLQSRHRAEVHKTRTTAVRLCLVLRITCLVRMMARIMRTVVNT